MSERAQTIFRAKKNADNPFVMIDRRAIENPELSWKAKGLLAYLLSRPDDWVVRFGDLVKRAPDGAASVRAAVKELREAGHVKVISEREGGKVVRWVYEVHESPDCDFQQVENLQVENLQVENRTLNNKDSITILSNTNTEGGEEPASPPSREELAPPSDFWEKELSPELTRVPFGEEFEEPKRQSAKQRRAERDAILDHPAIQAYRRQARLNVDFTWREAVANAVGTKPEDVARWETHIRDWIGMGWKKTSIKGMLESFQNGGIQQKNKREDAKARYERRIRELADGN